MGQFHKSPGQIVRRVFDINRDVIKVAPFENRDNLYYIKDFVNSSVVFEGWTKDNGSSSTTPSQGSTIWKIRLTIKNGNDQTEQWATTSGDVLFDKIWDDREDFFPAINLDEQFSRDYDGINDRDNGGDIHLFDVSDAVTYSFWTKINNTAAQRSFFAKAESGGNIDGLIFSHNSSGKLFLQMRTTVTDRQFTYNSTLATGIWVHIALAYAGGSNVNGALAYINASVESTPGSGTFGGGTMLTGQDFTVGSRNGAFHFSGRIARFLVWDKQLSSAEITELYNGGILADPTTHSASANLVSRYRMGDGDVFPIISDNVGTDDLTMENSTADDFVLDVP